MISLSSLLIIPDGNKIASIIKLSNIFTMFICQLASALWTVSHSILWSWNMTGTTRSNKTPKASVWHLNIDFKQALPLTNWLKTAKHFSILFEKVATFRFIYLWASLPSAATDILLQSGCDTAAVASLKHWLLLPSDRKELLLANPGRERFHKSVLDFLLLLLFSP